MKLFQRQPQPNSLDATSGEGFSQNRQIGAIRPKMQSAGGTGAPGSIQPYPDFGPSGANPSSTISRGENSTSAKAITTWRIKSESSLTSWAAGKCATAPALP